MQACFGMVEAHYHLRGNRYQRGNRSPIEVLGMEKISKCINEINFQRISKLFGTQLKSEKRRGGEEIDVLIGMQYAGYHPFRKEANGHLLLLESQYGQLIAGSHPQLMERTVTPSLSNIVIVSSSIQLS